MTRMRAIADFNGFFALYHQQPCHSEHSLPAGRQAQRVEESYKLTRIAQIFTNIIPEIPPAVGMTRMQAIADFNGFFALYDQQPCYSERSLPAGRQAQRSRRIP